MSGSTGPIFTICFHQMKDICVNLSDRDLFSDSSRDVAMATDFLHNMRNDLHSTRWRFETDLNIAIPLQVLTSNIFATFCAILVNIGPLTPEIMPEVFVTLGTKLQKSALLQNISASTKPNFTNFLALLDIQHV